MLDKISENTCYECLCHGGFEVKNYIKKELKMRGVSMEKTSSCDKKKMSMETLIELRDSGIDVLVKEAKRQVIENYSDFVRYIINRFYPEYASKHMQEMYQCGIIGVLAAFEKYSTEYAFTTYSKFYIVHEISGFIRFVEKTGSPLYARYQTKIKKAKEDFEEAGIEYNEKNVAEYLRCSLKTARKEMQAAVAGNLVYIDGCIEDMLGFPEFVVNNVEKQSINNFIARDIIRKLVDIGEKKAVLVVYDYIVKQKTFKEIACNLKTSPKEVKKIYTRTIKALRKELEEYHDLAI